MKFWILDLCFVCAHSTNCDCTRGAQGPQSDPLQLLTSSLQPLASRVLPGATGRGCCVPGSLPGAGVPKEHVPLGRVLAA